VGCLGTVNTAILTPFDDQLNVDEAAFVALLQYLGAHGSDGVVVAGSTGEGATLTDDEHMGLVALALKERPQGMTVIAGTGSNDTRHAVELTERATELGVDGTLSVTPYYNRPNFRGLKAHYTEIARATDKPLLLYNIPSRSALDVSNEQLAELGQIDNVVGVKQANNDNLAPIDGLEVYAGNDDAFLPTLEMGGAGGILVASHLVGDEMRRMVDEPDNRVAIDESIRDLYALMGLTTNPIPVKAAVELIGLRAGGLRLPLVEASDEEKAEIRAVLERHGLLSGAAS
jgi:4-hydroxy-tetrahydrodipicolinate synthase